MSDNFPKNSISFAQKLIQCPSVTPKEGGALTYLQQLLEPIGFETHRLKFEDSDTPAVENLYASFGSGTPHLVFAGHTDVVPEGPIESWTYPPYEGLIDNNILYGRGAVDMKGGIAAFVSASKQVIQQHSSNFDGKISLLITGDEEGPAINGTKKVLAWCKKNGEIFDACLVGEPTNPKILGEAIKIGRRGSLSATLTVFGTQGHVAYPELAHNPIPDVIQLLSDLTAEPLDQGTNDFQPSNLEITSINDGYYVRNVIPKSVQAFFNIRYNDKWTQETLMNHINGILKTSGDKINAKYSVEYSSDGADSFVTKNTELIDTLSNAINKEVNLMPSLSTDGGTSDARFIKNYCPVVEFGLVNETIHQIDERVPTEDLIKLSQIYYRFLVDFFKL